MHLCQTLCRHPGCACTRPAQERVLPQTKAIKEGDANLAGDHIREGLAAVLAVRVPSPEFEGQTKTRLGNPEIRKLVDGVVASVRAQSPHVLALAALVAHGMFIICSTACHPCLCFHTSQCEQATTGRAAGRGAHVVSPV